MFIPGWREVLGVEPVAFTTWAVLLAITLSKLLVLETYKQLRGRKLAEQVYHAPSPAGRQARDWGREAMGQHPR